MINLLPLQYKKELKQEEQYRTIVILGIVFLIFLISLFLVLVATEIYLKGQVESLKLLVKAEEEISRAKGTQELREQMVAINQRIVKVNSFFQGQIDSIGILEKVFQTLPPEIKLSSLVWQKADSRFSLTGFSPSREILVDFRNSLEKENLFNNINFSAESWLKATNIDFQVTFDLNVKGQ